ncbi:MAG: glycosyltransferase [Clostridia bacterium]|nr:glycosyltransferase [Clostridia bacterium]
MKEFSVGLFNDSFPPSIDGVAQTVKNYAENLHKKDCRVTVVTPKYRDAQDNYPYEVFRYPSIPASSLVGYRVGVPFDPETLLQLHKKKFDIMHIHAPFASSVLVSTLNHRHRVPTVLTYHTKFDIDLEKRITNTAFRKLATEFVSRNVNAVDEVWVVTESCGEALHNIGYDGPYRVMENGTDFPKGVASPEAVVALRENYDLREDVPVFLFVGRLMWYKNLKLILDSLKLVKDGGQPFRAFIIGEGYDAPAIEQYSVELGLENEVTFTGPIRDREYLRTFYSVCDLFLFPSTYDTCGIVVKEAAACDCPSLLVEGSCAAEGVIHRQNGFLAKEEAASCAAAITDAVNDRRLLRQVGVRAGESLYLSWEDAVGRAYDRYREILEKK